MQQEVQVRDDLVLTIDETCRALKISRPLIYRLIKNGQLEKIKLGKASRFTGDSVRRLVSAACIDRDVA
jgi:excisionase family DNA binding protein